MTTLDGLRVTIIGGAGFIGHHLATSLASKGVDVEVLDSLQVNNLLSIAADHEVAERRDLYLRFVNQRLDLMRDAGVRLHPLDARDYHTLSRVVGAFEPHVIVHLAAVAHAGRSNKDPFSTFDHSLRTLENALDQARGHVDHFIYLSSSMVYGNFLADEVDETHPLEPIGIYGALKLSGEKIVIAYNQVFDLPYTIVRPSALYGPRCVSRRVGQVFIENALRGEPLRVEGDGDERLDFTYVDDLVSGIEQIIQSEASKNQTFNLTYGSSRSIKELVGLVVERFPHVGVEHVARDDLMPVRGTLSIDKARDVLGYRPQNPLEVGVAKYVDWYKSIVEGPSASA